MLRHGPSRQVNHDDAKPGVRLVFDFSLLRNTRDQLQHRSDHESLLDYYGGETLIGCLDLSFTVADPKRDFRACSSLCVGLLGRPLLNDTPISNTDLEFVGLFTFFART